MHWCVPVFYMSDIRRKYFVLLIFNYIFVRKLP